MRLKTTVGLESRFMPISDALFRQRKCKGCKNGVSCNAAIFADSNDTKFNVFGQRPLFRLFQSGPR